MKILNKLLITVVILSTGFITSCNYLDVSDYFDGTEKLEERFKKRVYAEGFFSNAYEVMYDELADITTGGNGGGSMWATDDLLLMNDQICKRYQNGDYNPNDLLWENDKWKRVYETIRKASTFLQYIDYCEEMTLNERTEYKAQARFLRGCAYWILLRDFGPIPILPEEGLDINLSYEQMAVPRNSLDECVNFISEEFLAAARILPLDWGTSTNVGRPTKGAALAARARLYLYAASPLFNEKGNELFELKDHEGRQLIPQEYDESKWARAAAAALDVINLNKYALYTALPTATSIAPPTHAVYSEANFPDGWKNVDPYESYRQLFDGTISSYKNKEIIFTRPNDNRNAISQLVGLSIPYWLGGSNAVAVTMKQFEAYYRRDGKTVQEAKDANEYEYDNVTANAAFTTSDNQYQYVRRDVSFKFVNLEPRFYVSIAYPGTYWDVLSNTEKGASSDPLSDKTGKQIFYYQGQYDGNNFSNPDRFPITGMGLHKYINRSDGTGAGKGEIMDKFEPGIRYADVLLWYAEAVNELTTEHTAKTWQNEDVVIRRDVNALHLGMKPVRMRAGLPDFEDAVYSNRDVFRSVLKRERQIEFFAENKRYYDLRRWRDAEVQENIPSRGFDTSIPIARKALFYSEVSVSNTYPKYFDKSRMYLWPIPQYELVRNKKLTQNPGWN